MWELGHFRKYPMQYRRWLRRRIRRGKRTYINQYKYLFNKS